MLKVKFIALLLSLVMAIQMLPVQQIGAALGNNTWTEELPHHADDCGKCETAKNFHPFIPPSDYCTSPLIESVAALSYIHYSEGIPPNHSSEVTTPPPDGLV